MTENELLDSGFVRYRQNPDNSRIYISSFQKAIIDDKGTKYIIDCDVYDFKKIQPNSAEEIWFDFRAQLSKNNLPFIVKTIDWFKGPTIKKPSLTEIEVFFETLWKNTNCDYYSKNH